MDSLQQTEENWFTKWSNIILYVDRNENNLLMSKILKLLILNNILKI